MALVPLTYTVRSLLERRSSTALTIVAMGATVATLAGVLALQQGFQTLFTGSGRVDLVVLLRKGANAEGESGFGREAAEVLLKGLPEAAADPDGRPLTSGELYLAVRRPKEDGGETNVPIRGVQQQTFAIHGERLRLVEGQRFAPGNDEVIVGRSLVGRIRDCRLGAVIQLNTTPFRVVGVFEHDGPYASEVWGDLDRMSEALQRPGVSRVIAQVVPGADLAAMQARLDEDKQVPCKAMTERAYLAAQTGALSAVLLSLGFVLAVIMGTAAVLTGTNTMLAALAARTHEVGVLLALGFRPFPIFLSFLLESMLLGLMGGVVGCLMALPLDGLRTGTTNFNTFTEVAFAFRITPTVLLTAVTFALVLGIVGGTVPAILAARLRPTQALRRE
ncbi:MAG: ABC transporter permease [Planctomycetes bacterium]|nr:ABC transporter permease [Planctomycetota bacterium]